MDIVSTIRNYVEDECKKPTSKYGYEPFLFHFTPMVKYAEKLADELGGDKEVILIAAWLHDIGSIIYGRSDHHITGAKIAEEKLKELNYSNEKIELIKKCILNHRGSVDNERGSIEEQIISEADTLSQFDNVSGMFKAAFIFEKLDQSEATISVKEKVERKYKKLHFKESRELVREKYRAMMFLLN